MESTFLAVAIAALATVFVLHMFWYHRPSRAPTFRIQDIRRLTIDSGQTLVIRADRLLTLDEVAHIRDTFTRAMADGTAVVVHDPSISLIVVDGRQPSL